jgi:hypothetical protein
LRNTKISIFGGISKFRLWADFGKFCQFWAEFAALAVADSMPKDHLKSLKPHNFWTVSPNFACSISLESYNPYLQHSKSSKNPPTYYVHNTLPKVQKAHSGCLGPLGVKKNKQVYIQSLIRLAMYSPLGIQNSKLTDKVRLLKYYNQNCYKTLILQGLLSRQGLLDNYRHLFSS